MPVDVLMKEMLLTLMPHGVVLNHDKPELEDFIINPVYPEAYPVLIEGKQRL
jgi:hypothetical protein